MSDALELLAAAGGQHSMHSPLGKWAQAVSLAFGAGLPAGVRVTELLMAARGQVSIHSRFGLWAMRVSRRIDVSLTATPPDYYRAVGGERQIISPYGKFMAAVTDLPF